MEAGVGGTQVQARNTEDGRQHPKLEEAGRTLPESHQRELGPADTLVVDFQLPEQQNECR